MTTPGTRLQIIVHENILQEGLLPADLLGEHRFEMRTFKEPAELSPLLTSFPPQAMIFDLRDQEKNVEEGLRLIEVTGTQTHLPPFPILGFHAKAVLEKWDRYQHEKYFGLGLTQIFPIPLDEKSLNETLQTYLGLQFRKFDRKWVDQEIVLATSKKKYKAVLKIINRECLAIEGDDLPVVGTNVRVKSLSPYPIALDHPCYVIKNLKPAGLLLRLIEPSTDLVARIDGLPEKSSVQVRPPPSPAMEVPAAEKLGDTPDFLQDPSQLLPIDVTLGETFFENWFLQKGPTPKTWLGILKGASEKARQNYQKYKTTRPAIARAQSFNVILEAQLQGLRNLGAEDLQKLDSPKTLLDHEQKIKTLCAALQSEITKLLQDKDQDGFLWAGEIKTNLQKNLAALKKTLSIKGIMSTGPVTPPSPAASEPLPKKAKTSVPPQLPRTQSRTPKSKKILAGIFLLMAGTSIFWGYQKMMAPRRALTLVSEAETKQFSPFALQISQIKARGEIQWTVVMANTWSALSEADMDRERGKMLEGLRIQGVSQAEFKVAQPARNFAFDHGTFRVPKLRPKSQKN